MAYCTRFVAECENSSDALSTLASDTSSVGDYAITPAADDSDYTITADNKTKLAGSANPAFTAHYTGFVNGDSCNNRQSGG